MLPTSMPRGPQEEGSRPLTGGAAGGRGTCGRNDGSPAAAPEEGVPHARGTGGDPPCQHLKSRITDTTGWGTANMLSGPQATPSVIKRTSRSMCHHRHTLRTQH